jgi:hypothetical protein
VNSISSLGSGSVVHSVAGPAIMKILDGKYGSQMMD